MTAETIEARAEAIAQIAGARRTGRGWTAKCPAHDDRHPSLQISQGRNAVLLRCWSHGCTPQQIVMAFGLTMTNLFVDVDLTSAQRRQAAEAKTARDKEQLRQRTIDREQRNRIFKLERLVDALGAKLACQSGGRELGMLFHLTCDRLHEAEAAMPSNQDSPRRLSEPSAVPGWVHEQLIQIFQKEKAAGEAARGL